MNACKIPPSTSLPPHLPFPVNYSQSRAIYEATHFQLLDLSLIQLGKLLPALLKVKPSPLQSLLLVHVSHSSPTQSSEYLHPNRASTPINLRLPRAELVGLITSKVLALPKVGGAGELDSEEAASLC